MSTVGHKGKFSDRIYRMKLYRYAKINNYKIKNGAVVKEEENSNIIKNKIIGGVGVGVAILGNTFVNLIGIDKDDRSDNIVDGNNFFVSKKKIFNKSKKNDVTDIDKLIKDIDNNNISKLYDKNITNSNTISDDLNKINNNNIVDYHYSKDKYSDIISRGIDSINYEQSYLACQIIKKISKELDKKLNDIEVLESELFLLNYNSSNELYLEKCKMIREEIKLCIKKINSIVDQYNIYKSTRFLDNYLDIDKEDLVVDICNFKRLNDVKDIKDNFYDNYDLFDKYKLLYGRLVNITDEVNDINIKSKDKVKDLDLRDKKYNLISDKLVDMDKFSKDLNIYVDKGNNYVDEISKIAGKIKVEEVSHYKLSGFNNLVSSSLRYLGLLVLSPFRGLLPGIAFSTYAANRMVLNLYKSMKLEKITDIFYNAKDLQFELDNRLSDLDYNYSCVEKTLENIERLKEDFKKIYNSDMPFYDDTFRKINDIERIVYNNKGKLNKIKRKLKENKKINEETLNKCRVLKKESKTVVKEEK